MSVSRSINMALMVLLFATFGLMHSEPAFAKKPTSLPLSGFENNRGQEHAGKTIILGLATLHHSVFGGTIEIYDTKGKLVYRFDSSVHPKGGYFELPIRDRRLKNANSDDDPFTSGLAFRLVLRDGVSQDLPGKQVTLMADVTGFDPATQIVYVNPVTTLIAHYRDAKPNLTLSQAEAEVRAYLAFPDHLSVGLHVSTGVAHFDRARLLQGTTERE